MIFVIAPLHLTVDEVLDWFEERGVERPRIWSGPDGTLRATALVEAP
jgi:hypothetical protein